MGCWRQGQPVRVASRRVGSVEYDDEVKIRHEGRLCEKGGERSHWVYEWILNDEEEALCVIKP